MGKDSILNEHVSLSPVSRTVNLKSIEALVNLIVARCAPVSVWLFGSRARGDAREDSDWDLLVVLPDETVEDEVYASLSPWHLRRLTRTNADVVYCNESEFAEGANIPNTLAYEAVRSGFLIHER